MRCILKSISMEIDAAKWIQLSDDVYVTNTVHNAVTGTDSLPLV